MTDFVKTHVATVATKVVGELKKNDFLNKFNPVFLFSPRQSYDVDIELNIPGTTNKSVNCLDLKNPFFRYTGAAPAAPPGTNQTSATDTYWNSLLASGDCKSYWEYQTS